MTKVYSIVTNNNLKINFSQETRNLIIIYMNLVKSGYAYYMYIFNAKRS